jgi:subtilisin family serine protease
MSSYPEPDDVPAGPEIRDGDGFLYVANQLLVNIADVPLVAAQLEEVGARQRDLPSSLNRYVAAYQVPEDVDLLDLIARLRAGRGKRRRRPRVGPNTVFFGSQTVQANLVLVGQPKYHGGPADAPWPGSVVLPAGAAGGPTVPVAVIDTGIDANASGLPLLNGRLDPAWQGLDKVYLPQTTDKIDLMGGHGTMVAGIIARNAPQACIMSFQALEPNGVGTDLTVGQCMSDAIDAGAKVLNLSLGGEAETTQPPVTIDSILAANKRKVVVVAAAGNTGTPTPNFYPACDSRVVSVAALDTTGNQPAVSPSSNSGAWITTCAPGVSVRSTYVTGDWEFGGYSLRHFQGHCCWSGTSFAAPHVAAFAAIAISGGQTPYQVFQALHLGPALPNYGVVVIPPHTALCGP